MRVDASTAAALDDRVDHGAAPTGLPRPDKHPVLLADGGRADGILDGVVVDADAAVVQVDAQMKGFNAAAMSQIRYISVISLSQW